MKPNQLVAKLPPSVQLQNINHPRSLRKADAAMARAMEEAILASLSPNMPGLTLEQLHNAVLPKLPQHLFPDGAKAGWWLKAVQLDLEAKRKVLRDRSSPLRLRLA